METENRTRILRVRMTPTEWRMLRTLTDLMGYTAPPALVRAWLRDAYKLATGHAYPPQSQRKEDPCR